MRDGAGSLLSRVRRWPNTHAGWIMAFLLTGLALLVRLPGYSGRPLWVDEMWRAALILDPRFLYHYFGAPTVETAITSPLYAIVVKSVSAFWVGPETLRLSSLLPGILAAPLAFALIRKAGGSYGLSALAGIMFALEANFMSYSKEMKPYMFEVFVHLGCLYAWFAAIAAQRPSARTWAIFYLAMLAAILSTPTVIFVLPAFGISLLLRYGMDRDIENLKKILFGFCGLAVAVLAMYVFIWRFGAKGGMLAVWADGFAGNGEHYASFAVRQFVAILKEAFRPVFGGRKGVLLTMAIAALFIAALAAGKLSERRAAWAILLFYFVFLLTVCLANLMRVWPLGALRPNLFLYGHAIIFTFLLAARLPHSRLVARIVLLCGAVIFLWQLLPASHESYFSGWRAMRAYLRALGPDIERSDLVMRDFSDESAIGKASLAKCPKQKTLIVTDDNMAWAIAYYTKYDSALHERTAWLTGPCVKIAQTPEAYLEPAQTASTLGAILPSTPDVWFVYSHLDMAEEISLKKIAGRYGRIEAWKDYQSAGYFRLTPLHPKRSGDGL